MKLHLHDSRNAMLRVLVALVIISAVGTGAAGQPPFNPHYSLEDFYREISEKHEERMVKPFKGALFFASFVSFAVKFPIAQSGFKKTLPTKKNPAMTSRCSELKKQVDKELAGMIGQRVKDFGAPNRSDIDSEIKKAIAETRLLKKPVGEWVRKTEEIAIGRIREFLLLQFDSDEKDSIRREIATVVTDLSGNERIGELNADPKIECGENELKPTDKEIDAEIENAVDVHAPTVITPKVRELIASSLPAPEDPKPINANKPEPGANANKNSAALVVNPTNASPTASPEPVAFTAPVEPKEPPPNVTPDRTPLYVTLAAIFIALLAAAIIANRVYKRVKLRTKRRE